MKAFVSRISRYSLFSLFFFNAFVYNCEACFRSQVVRPVTATHLPSVQIRPEAPSESWRRIRGAFPFSYARKEMAKKMLRKPPKGHILLKPS